MTRPCHGTFVTPASSLCPDYVMSVGSSYVRELHHRSFCNPKTFLFWSDFLSHQERLPEMYKRFGTFMWDRVVTRCPSCVKSVNTTPLDKCPSGPNVGNMSTLSWTPTSLWYTPWQWRREHTPDWKVTLSLLDWQTHCSTRYPLWPTDTTWDSGCTEGVDQ